MILALRNSSFHLVLISVHEWNADLYAKCTCCPVAFSWLKMCLSGAWWARLEKKKALQFGLSNVLCLWMYGIYLYIAKAAGVISIDVSLSDRCLPFNHDCVCAHYIVLLHQLFHAEFSVRKGFCIHSFQEKIWYRKKKQALKEENYLLPRL